MSTASVAADQPIPGDQMPPRAHVAALARELLAGEGTRVWHVRTAGLVATRLSVLFDHQERLARLVTHRSLALMTAGP